MNLNISEMYSAFRFAAVNFDFPAIFEKSAGISRDICTTSVFRICVLAYLAIFGVKLATEIRSKCRFRDVSATIQR